MTYKSLILPYATEDAERKNPFTYDMEVAAILCLAEAKRKKLEILGASPERISFILKLCYPLWAVPWENESLITDGLGIFSHTLTHMKLPDVKLFTEQVKKGTTVREVYRSALKSRAQTFEDFVATTQIPIEAIIADKKLLSAIFECVKQGLALKEDAKESLALAPSRLDKKAALERTEKLINHWSQIQSELKGLQYAIDVLNEEAGFHEQKILREIEQIREIYENDISRIKPAVEKKVEQLLTKRDVKVKRIIKTTEKELNAALKERDRYERQLPKWERDKSNYQRKMRNRRRRGDKTGASYWNHRIRTCKNKISEIKGKIQVLTRFIESTRKQGELGVKRLKKNYQVMIDQEGKKITDLAALHDSEIEVKQREIKELRSETASIINSIGKLMDQKRLHASNLKETTIPWRPEEATLICVPFYLVRYETEEKSRHYVHPPVVAMGYEGIIRKIQKAIWSFSLETRIKLVFRPRSRALTRMLSSFFAKTIQKDKTLEQSVYKIGSSNNLLNMPNFRDVLMKGMEELKNEGWIKPKEKGTILNTYTAH